MSSPHPSPNLKVRDALIWASDQFRKKPPAGPGSLTPELDGRVLLEHVTGWDRTHLILFSEEALTPSQLADWRVACKRRISGEPVAYIVGHKEFYGLDLVVRPGALVPRSDTETLVEAGLAVWRTRRDRARNFLVLDVCTGTGCVALALASRFEAEDPAGSWAVEATDLDPPAIDLARENADHLCLRVAVHQADLTAGLNGPWDLIVSNPPYLTTSETLERLGPGLWKEPSSALDGGIDGLDLVRRLIDEAFMKLTKGGSFCLEAAPSQFTTIIGLLRQAGFCDPVVHQDLAGLDRVVQVRKAT